LPQLKQHLNDEHNQPLLIVV